MVMKSVITVISLLVLSLQLSASDSLKFQKVFPEIKSKIIRDTIMDIRGTELDTFGYIPDIIFVGKTYYGEVLMPIYDPPKLKLHKSKGSYFGYSEDGTVRHGIRLNPEFHSNHVFEVEFDDYHLRLKRDTIHFKTLVNLKELNGKTCVYEFIIGRGEWDIECQVRTNQHFSKKEKQHISELFEKQELIDLIDSERGSLFCARINESLGLTQRSRKRIWCWTYKREDLVD